jgi:hypothetical protein
LSLLSNFGTDLDMHFCSKSELADWVIEYGYVTVGPFSQISGSLTTSKAK